MRCKDGKLLGIVGVARDMREKRAAEDALRALGEKYQNVVENAADCIYLLDTKGRFVHANKRALMLNEFKDLEFILERSFLDFVTTKHKEIVSNYIEKTRMGEAVQFHYETMTPKRKHKWWKTTFIPLRDGNGRVVNILGVSRDLTVERESKAKAEFFKEYSENILEKVPISVLVVNRTGQIIFANNNFLTKMKKNEESILGQKSF